MSQQTAYHQTKILIQKRMQSENTAEQMSALLHAAFRRALIAEEIVISRAEQNRMLREILDDIVTEMLKKF
ncbi:MAG: hypothetical protein HXY40_18425 [Chloroflexi bacterium]|nr:hypothetical protein [Chloroflexota bacterium]